MPRKKRQEDIFTEVLLDSNLLDVAEDLADQIMKPIKEFFDSGDSSGLKEKTFRPRERFDFEKCMGKYEMTVKYMVSNSGTSVFDAREHDMMLKVVNPESREGQAANLDLHYRSLRNEVLDLLEHEMGHYYLREMADAGDCIYYTDPKGLSVYYEDPQEIALHSKVLWNQLSRRVDFGQRYLDYQEKYGDNADANFKKMAQRTVSNAVERLQYDVGIPGVKFLKRVQKLYINHIFKYYLNPAIERAKREKVASELVRMASELVAGQYDFTTTNRQFRTIPFPHVIEVRHTTDDPHSWDAKMTVDFYGTDKVFHGESDSKNGAIRDLKKWTKKQYPDWF